MNECIFGYFYFRVKLHITFLLLLIPNNGRNRRFKDFRYPRNKFFGNMGVLQKSVFEFELYW